ncbi:hypothetical protein Daura_20390 [Dactylosporangium aurantiacum]|uniref:Uncharacterized protein n=1 Tax=Dactylosporangium aurantiacum TaxID=35754 RepID=A0A9Q9IS07_9ACTN|nr:hypothetical protein [Dactylosporangium aurantiacum]MDG6106173.1 hypothetical protein [Dactylosporangium aurantiacum]UWZ58324.1 hypothetical protein Daura_20390 [Dactylosporangium aurantiacum]
MNLASRWPAAVGLVAAAAVLVTVADRETAVTCVWVAVLCYLAAAALDRPWMAWAAIPAASVVIAVGEITRVGRWVLLGGAAVVLVVVGLAAGAPRRQVFVQFVAGIVYAGLALAALAFGPDTGLVVAGLVLAAHAAWDAVHHRRGTVVAPSLAEACMALDLPLGLGLVVLGLTA